MALDVYSSRDKRYGLAEQTVWGTATADAAAFTELDCEHVVLPVVPNLRESPQVHASRAAFGNDLVPDPYQVTPEFSLVMDAKQKTVDHLFYAYFQSVVEVGTGTMKKTFTTPATQPDFSTGNAGWTGTIIERYPVAAHSLKVKNCIAKSLTISVPANGRMKVTAAMIGMGVPATSTPSGTWTRANFEYWHAANRARFTMDLGGGVVPLAFKNIEIVLTQEVVGVGQDGAGNFQTWGIVSRAGTYKVDCVYDANILTARTALAAGTLIPINLGWGNVTPGTTDGDFDFAAQSKLTNASPDNQDLLGVTLEGKLFVPSGGTTIATLIMANSTLRSW